MKRSMRVVRIDDRNKQETEFVVFNMVINLFLGNLIIVSNI